MIEIDPMYEEIFAAVEIFGHLGMDSTTPCWWKIYMQFPASDLAYILWSLLWEAYFKNFCTLCICGFVIMDHKLLSLTRVLSGVERFLDELKEIECVVYQILAISRWHIINATILLQGSSGNCYCIYTFICGLYNMCKRIWHNDKEFGDAR